MKRFFSTFMLLTAVAFSLVVSNSLSKDQTNAVAVKATEPTAKELQMSIDLTEAEIFRSKQNEDFVSLPN